MSKVNVDAEPIDKSLVIRVLEGLSVGIVVTNAQGRVTWANPAAQRVLGLDPDGSRGRPLQGLLQDPRLAKFWRDAVAGEATVTADLDLSLPRPSRLKAAAAPAFDPQGQVLGRALFFYETPEGAAAARPAGEAPEGLTPQEMKVLGMVGEGLSNRQIAERMNVAPSTVRSHLKHLYAKLGIRSRSEAISYALRNPAGG